MSLFGGDGGARPRVELEALLRLLAEDGGRGADRDNPSIVMRHQCCLMLRCFKATEQLLVSFAHVPSKNKT